MHLQFGSHYGLLLHFLLYFNQIQIISFSFFFVNLYQIYQAPLLVRIHEHVAAAP